MKKQLKRIFALLLAMTLLLSNGTIGFASPETGETKKESLHSSRIALYQNGDLSAAYAEGVESERYAAPEAGTAEAAIYNGLKNYEESIDLSSFHLSIDQVEHMFQMVINSNADLFYVSNLFHCYYDTTTNEVTDYIPEYIAPKAQLQQMTAAFDSAVAKALSGIDESMTQLEKALYLHDYIIKLNAYDNENFENDTVPNVSHSAYGPLVLNISVCDGYSLAYSYLLQKCGVNARLITSTPMAHAWSAVEIDGSWYFVDLTHDDPVCGFYDYDWDNGEYVLSSTGDDYRRVEHGAFLASESLWKQTEYADGCYTGWAQTDIQCNSTKYDNAIWKTNANEYSYCDGSWYYLDERYDETAHAVTETDIMKTEDPAMAGEVFLSLSDYNNNWTFADGSYFAGIFSNVSVYAPAKVLFYNVNDSVYFVDLTDPAKTPKLYASLVNTEYEGQACIFGLIIVDDTLYFGLQNDPNSKHMVIYDYLGAVTPGDVNNDGTIDTDDALLVLKIAIGTPVTNVIREAADVDNSGTIDTDDALLVLKRAIGIIKEF